jgi:hypothetical protein
VTESAEALAVTLLWAVLVLVLVLVLVDVGICFILSDMVSNVN